MRSAVITLLLVVLCGTADAGGPPDIEQTDAVLDRLSHTLPRFGIGELHIVGGGALSLARTARQGAPLSWNDIDVRGVSSAPLDRGVMERLAEALTLDGWAEVLEPGPIEFMVHTPDTRHAMRSQGYGLRMRHASGLRFDVAVLRSPSDIKLSGYNSAESLMIPLGGDPTIAGILGRLRAGRPRQVVARGHVVEPHGKAAAVLRGSLSLTNRYQIAVEPELAALRFLRAKEKLARDGGRVSARRDTHWLLRNLRHTIRRAPASKDPSYTYRVQEQATELLRSGDPQLLREAQRMGLDVPALARGTIERSRAAKAQRTRRAATARTGPR